MNSALFSAYSSKKWFNSKRNEEIFFFINQLVLVLFYTFIFITPTFATNYYVEAQIAQALKSTVSEKEIIWLKPEQSLKTVALFQDAHIKNALGSILILADLNHHPNWPHIIHPLRTKLAQHGWNTLSLQMPIKEKYLSPLQLEAIEEIAEKRINAALAYLAEKNSQSIIIIARRNSANIAIKYILKNKMEKPKITAFVSISSFDSPWINSSQLLRDMPVPYLDLYAQHDAPEVLSAAPKRLVAAKIAGQLTKKTKNNTLSDKIQQLAMNKTGNSTYRQVKINGAHTQFIQHEDTLLKTIRGWLRNYESKPQMQ